MVRNRYPANHEISKSCDLPLQEAHVMRDMADALGVNASQPISVYASISNEWVYRRNSDVPGSVP